MNLFISCLFRADEIRMRFFEFRMCAISTAMIPPREVPMMVSFGVILFWVMISLARSESVKFFGILG